MSMGAMAATGYGAEALDARFNVSGYHVPSKMPQFGFSDYMDSEDAARYNQHWDDLASGKNLPPGMDADDLTRYNQGVRKLDENLALSRIDPDALVKLRAEEGARVNALLNGSIEGGSKASLDGVTIINKKFAGQTFELSGDLAKNYPDGVDFTWEGFPDFSPYSTKSVQIQNLQGDAYYDIIKANQAAGYKTTPKGFTWHHLEDGTTMMLVPTELHSAVRHTGGASLIRQGLRP